MVQLLPGAEHGGASRCSQCPAGAGPLGGVCVPNASSSLAVTSERAWESPRDVGLGGSALANPGGMENEGRFPNGPKTRLCMHRSEQGARLAVERAASSLAAGWGELNYS